MAYSTYFSALLLFLSVRTSLEPDTMLLPRMLEITESRTGCYPDDPPPDVSWPAGAARLLESLYCDG